jgi:hypothetical protein
LTKHNNSRKRTATPTDKQTTVIAMEANNNSAVPIVEDDSRSAVVHKADTESLNNITTDTSLNMSMDSTRSNKSNNCHNSNLNEDDDSMLHAALGFIPVVDVNRNNNGKNHPRNNDDEADDMDPDINIAAEQIVNEFTEHLNQRTTVNTTGVNTNNTTNNDDEPLVGVMSTSLAAGGFEELIAGLESSVMPPHPLPTVIMDGMTTTTTTTDENQTDEYRCQYKQYDQQRRRTTRRCHEYILGRRWI